MAHTCFLSGIEIPKGKYSREHLAPRSKVPPEISQQADNIKPSIKIFNYIKGDRFLCQWEEQKYGLVFYAYNNWKLKPIDKKLLREALKGMPKIDACEHCICNIYKEYCIKQR